MFRNYLKTAIRHFVRNKVYMAINIAGLALGMTVALLLFLYIMNEQKYDKFNENLNRIYRIEAEWGSSIPGMIGHILPESVPEIDKCVRFFFPGEVTLNANNVSYTEPNLAFADNSCFDVFDFELVLGNPEKALVEPLTMVLTEIQAHKFFGTENPLGKTISYNNEIDFRITGVINDIEYSHLLINGIASIGSIDILAKMQYGEENYLLENDSWMYPTYAMLAPNHNVKNVENKMTQVLRPLADFQKLNFKLLPLKDIYFSEPNSSERNTQHGNLQLINLLIVLFILILAIAGINFVNLSTAISTSRNKEIGIRKVVGSSRWQLILQHIFESVLLCLIALGISLLLAESLEHSINQMLSLKLDVHSFYSPIYFFTSIGFAVLLGILSGIYPALQLTSGTPTQYLKNRSGRLDLGGFRKGLIVFQFIVSICLIIAVIVTQEQSQFFRTKDLGFDKEHILVLRTNSKLLSHANRFKNKALDHSDIQHVSYSGEIPGNRWGGWCCMQFNHQGKYRHDYNLVDPDFFQTYGMEIVQGREFDRTVKSDDYGAFIINEASIQTYQFPEPLGGFIDKTGSGASGGIVGVVKDFHYRSFHHRIVPVVFYWSTREKDLKLYKYVSIKINGQNIPGTISHLKSEWNQICPEYPFNYQFFDETFDRLYKAEQRLGRIFFLFSLLAIFISCLGILGLVIFTTQKRIKEIGIRKTLGASIPNILVLLTKDFTKWIIIANLLAWPIAWFGMNKWLENFAYRIELTWWMFALAGGLALAIALLTVSWQAVRAALANPVEALRYE